MRRGDTLAGRLAIAAVLLAAAWFAARWSFAPEAPRAADGFGFGYTPNPDGTREFLATLDAPTFAEAGADAVAKTKNVDTFLYRYLDRAHRAAYGSPFVAWNQGAHGSCVSFAFALGSYCGHAVDYCTGRLPAPPLAVATEPIYGGSRTAARQPPIKVNNGGDGSYGGAAARWIVGLADGTGGILYRTKYGDVDLSAYSIPRSQEWGRYGVPAPLAKLANENRAQAVALVEDWPSLVSAVESGYCVAICSTVGYGGTTTRDADAFLPRGRSWSHAMLICAVRHAANAGQYPAGQIRNPRDGALVVNSWGTKWVGGPRWPADQPEGSFWASRRDVEAALAQGDSFAIGGVGFAYRDLNHGDWLAPGEVAPDEN
jgi:hypothetical protein